MVRVLLRVWDEMGGERMGWCLDWWVGLVGWFGALSPTVTIQTTLSDFHPPVSLSRPPHSLLLFGRGREVGELVSFLIPGKSCQG